jgi:hypothetical protein
VAQKVQVLLTDDLDGSDAQETIEFGFEGTSYEIDLNKKNAEALRKAVEKYVGAARKSGRSGSSTSRGRGARATGRQDRDYNPKEVRSWAESQGIEVSARGRVPADLVAKFQAANA